MRKTILLGVFLLVMNTPLWAQDEPPLVLASKVYAHYQVAFGNFHFHTMYSDSTPGLTTRTPATAYSSYDRAENGVRVFASLDHGCHLNYEEWRQTRAQAAEFNTTHPGKVALAGFELTGTSQVDGHDPRDDQGFGHLGVLNSPGYWSTRVEGNGEPGEITVKSLPGFLRALAGTHDSLAFFCHPSLYDTARFNNLTPELVAQYPKAIEKLIGCELNAHTFQLDSSSGFPQIVQREGLWGPRRDLSDSNEAFYQFLLGLGIPVGAMMAWDNHAGGYGQEEKLTGLWLEGPVTERSVLKCLRARRFFATEQPGAAIKLIAWQGDQVKVMGETIKTNQRLNCLMVVDWPSVKSFTIVCISRTSGMPAVEQHLELNRPGQTRFGKELYNSLDHWRCIYAKAELLDSEGKIKNIVSSPIWIDYNRPVRAP